MSREALLGLLQANLNDRTRGVIERLLDQY